MARRKKMSEMTLDVLIPQYAENKSILDDYKKICDDENKQIKELMDEGSYVVGDWKATKIVTVRESFNEDKLLETVKNLAIKGIVKKKEYVDMDALESAIYKGKISKEMLLEIDKCRETKEIVALRVSKNKEKEE